MLLLLLHAARPVRTMTAKASPGFSRALLRTYSGVYLLIKLHICFSDSSCSKLRLSCCVLQARSASKQRKDTGGSTVE
jgi:hypothetical protein